MRAKGAKVRISLPIGDPERPIGNKHNSLSVYGECCNEEVKKM